jgi:hypothetical protein
MVEEGEVVAPEPSLRLLILAGRKEKAMRKASVAEHRERHVEKVLTAHRSRTRWAAVAALEVALAAAVVILDVGIPTFVILALMTLSLLIRRQGLSTWGSVGSLTRGRSSRPRWPWLPGGRWSTSAC